MNSKSKIDESLTAVTHTDSLENKKIIINREKDRNIMLISKLDIG